MNLSPLHLVVERAAISTILRIIREKIGGGSESFLAGLHTGSQTFLLAVQENTALSLSVNLEALVTKPSQVLEESMSLGTLSKKYPRPTQFKIRKAHPK